MSVVHFSSSDAFMEDPGEPDSCEHAEVEVFDYVEGTYTDLRTGPNGDANRGTDRGGVGASRWSALQRLGGEGRMSRGTPVILFTDEELRAIYLAVDRACELDMAIDEPALDTARGKLVAYVYDEPREHPSIPMRGEDRL